MFWYRRQKLPPGRWNSFAPRDVDGITLACQALPAGRQGEGRVRAPEYRGQGLARQVVAQAIAAAEKWMGVKIELL